jgi:hypothetical protein
MAREEHLKEQLKYLDDLAPDRQIGSIDEIYAGIALVSMGDLLDKLFNLLVGQTVLSHFRCPFIGRHLPFL